MKKLVKKSLYLTVCISCLFFLGVNCSSDSEEEESVNSAKSITLADFQVSFPDISASNIEDEINDIDSFYNEDPEEEEESDCIDAILFPSSSKFNEAEDGFYEFSIPDTDVSECFGDSDRFIISMYFKIKILDGNGDPVDLSEFSFDDLDSYSGPVSAVYMIMKNYCSPEFEDNKKSWGVIKEMECSTDNPGEPYIQGDGKDGVSIYGLTDIESSDGETYQMLSKLDFIEINEEDGTYYTGGTIDFQLNNWNGTMTYHATDPEIAPTYTATDGTDTVTGQFEGEDKGAKSSNFANIREKIKNKIRYRNQ